MPHSDPVGASRSCKYLIVQLGGSVRPVCTGIQLYGFYTDFYQGGNDADICKRGGRSIQSVHGQWSLSITPVILAIHYANVVRIFASQLFQPFANLPIVERKNTGFSQICIMDR